MQDQSELIGNTKVYYALAPKDRTAIEAVKIAKPKHILLSYALWKDKGLEGLLAEFKEVNYSPVIMLDSGAFTFSQKGIPLALEQYYEDSQEMWLEDHPESEEYPFEIFLHTLGFDVAHAELWTIAVEENEEGLELIRFVNFLEQYHNVIDYVIGPDTIGDAEITYQAWQIFQHITVGIKAIPVFHYGSDASCLKKYIDSGFNYIALGGTVLERKNNGKGIKVKIANWINTITSKYPGVKLHLLGSQDTYFLKNCPALTSMDGTAFSFGAGKDTVGQGRAAKIKRTIQNIERKEERTAVNSPVFQLVMAELLGFDNHPPHNHDFSYERFKINKKEYVG